MRYQILAVFAASKAKNTILIKAKNVLYLSTTGTITLICLLFNLLSTIFYLRAKRKNVIMISMSLFIDVRFFFQIPPPTPPPTLKSNKYILNQKIGLIKCSLFLCETFNLIYCLFEISVSKHIYLICWIGVEGGVKGYSYAGIFLFRL